MALFPKSIPFVSGMAAILILTALTAFILYAPKSGFGANDSISYPAADSVSVSKLRPLTGSTRAAGASDLVLYGGNAYGLSNMIEINLTRKTSQQVGQLAFQSQALDIDPGTGYVYYFKSYLTGEDEFAYWDCMTGENTIVRTYDPPPGFSAKGMAFAPDGTLYLLGNGDELCTIDKQSGELAFIGKVTGVKIGRLGRTGDIAFDQDGTLYLATYKSLYKIDMASLEATLLYTDMIAGQDPIKVWTGLAYCDGLLYASDIEAKFVGDPRSKASIYSVDPTTGVVAKLFSSQMFLNDLSACMNGPRLSRLELKGESVSEDTVIVDGSYSPLNFGATPDMLAAGVGPAGTLTRLLIRWDLSSIRADTTVVRAQMSLYSRHSQRGSWTIDAHRVLQPWVEGNLDGLNRQLDNPVSSCWIEYGNGLRWNAPGADGAADREATVISSATHTGTGWVSWDVTEAVRNWLDGNWDNNGVILKSNNEALKNLRFFLSSECRNAAFRPTMVVEYVQP
jgi:hypothetical protein